MAEKDLLNKTATSVEKSQLVLIYRSLNKGDVRQLTKWLDSPMHNQREDVKKLHVYFTSNKDRLYKTSSLTKTRIWKKIFPGEVFDDARLRQTFHWALKAVMGFLAYDNWSRKEIEPNIALINELNHRRLPGMTERTIKRTIKSLEAAPLRNETYFRNRYQLEQELDYYQDYFQVRAKPRFQEVADNLDITYLIEKLRASWNMLYQQRLYRTEYEIRFLEEVVNYVQSLELENYPVLAIHYYGYQGFTEDDHSGRTIGLLRTAVEKHGHLLPDNDRRHVIVMAINLCVANMNKGREAFIREAFEWNRIGLDQNVISLDEKINRHNFWNIVAIAIKLEEYHWAESFIDQYAYQLEEDIRENTEQFAKANLKYGRQDLAAAMGLLIMVDFKHPVYNLSAKILLAKIYYELGEFDALDSQIDTTLKYIRRKELADVQRNNYRNIILMIRQLARLNPHDPKNKTSLRERIEETTPLTEKKWLLEQIDQY